MAATFFDLIATFGVPRVLVVNRWRDRIDAPYLLIRRFLAIPRRRYRDVRAQLEERTVVFSQTGTRRGPLGGIVPTVEVAVAEDVEGMSQEGLDAAAAEQRVLRVTFTRSMGDGSVRLDRLGGPDGVPLEAVRHAPYVFVFDPPCRLSDEALPHEEAWAYGTAGEYLQPVWERYMALPFPLPPTRRRDSSAPR